MPVRKIPKNYRFLTGVFGGTKNVGKASFESPLERDLQILLEFDTDVLEYEAQPVRIPRTDGKGKARFFTPDVRIVYRPDAVSPWRGKTLIVEVKCREDLTEGKNFIFEKMKAGIAWCRQNGAIFKVFSESRIRSPLLDNARFLLPFRRITPDVEDEEYLLDTLRRNGPLEASRLLESLSDDPDKRSRLLWVLWYLVSVGRIGTDLSRPLTQNSLIESRIPQEGFHGSR